MERLVVERETRREFLVAHRCVESEERAEGRAFDSGPLPACAAGEAEGFAATCESGVYGEVVVHILRHDELVLSCGCGSRSDGEREGQGSE